jgi:SAM-dependent methyltransferase
MSPEIHPAAAVGFERATDAYDRGRPDYPADAIATLLSRVGDVRGIRTLDLAAGTGKLTQHLVSAGAAVVAVEPVAAMRGALARSLPPVRIVAGTAEAIPLREGSVEVATVGQAFHWFEATAAIQELHRVLAPMGRLALVWNVRDETDPLQARLTEIMAPYRGNAPGHGGGRWREAFDATDLFEPLERSSVRFEQTLDADGLADRMLSVSFIATLDPSRRDDVERAARRLVPPDGVVALPYRVDIWSTARR